MVTIKSRQIINLIMALVLITAPFGALFAGVHMTHETEMMQSIDHSIDRQIIHVDSMTDMNDHKMNAFDQSCEKQCANCAYCSAVTLSYFSSNEKLHSVYIPSFNNALIDIVSDVDIRPPRHFTSI